MYDLKVILVSLALFVVFQLSHYTVSSGIICGYYLSNCYYHGDCDESTVSCKCYTGWTGHLCYERVCKVECVHGICQSTSRYQCDCNKGWTGNNCKENLNLKNWCKSISDNVIANSYLNSIPNGLEVNCDSKKVNYNANKAKNIGPKILLDSNQATASYKPNLYILWRQHPDLRDYCCFPDPGSNYQMTIVRKLRDFDNSVDDDIHALTSEGLRKEMDSVCPKNQDDTFCTIAPALRIVDIVATLPPGWTTVDETRKDAILLNFVVLMKRNPSKFGTLTAITVAEQKRLLVKFINIMLSYIQATDIENLKGLVVMLPPLTAYTQSGSSCHLDNICIFMKTVEQLESYMDEVNTYENPVHLYGTKRLILNTGMDYQEFLRQKQLDRILQVLTEHQATSLNIANELKKHITKKFTELRSYYEQIENFNANIAESDIGYIRGRLVSLQDKVDSVVEVFKAKMVELLVEMIVALVGEVVQESVELGLTIAENSNPIGWLTGSASGKEIADAVSELADALGKMVKGAALTALWTSVANYAENINTKVGENKILLDSVKSLIFEASTNFEASKQTFLKEYRDYDPKVSTDDIVNMNGLWAKLVDEACGVVASLDTTAGIALRTIIDARNLCVDLPVLAQRMGNLYLGIYDFQFELMDALATYMRSRVTLDAAKEINSEFTSLTDVNPDSDTTLDTLQYMGGLTYITYKAHILQAVNHYCNILEYQAGGIQPKECRGPETDLALLVSSSVPVCVSQSHNFYYVPSKVNSTASVDVSELFAGASVSFKIPDSQWLIDNKWIAEEERHYVFYVKKFEVYLPTKSKRPQNFIVSADPIMRNEIVPGGTVYMIIPHVPLVHEYILGPRRTVCHDQKMPNPYTTCETKQTSNICQLTQKNSRYLFPSIYSQWAITVKGGEHLTPPNPATDLLLMFGMELCKTIPVDTEDTFQAKFSQQNSDVEECCLSGQFRPNATADCEPCPSGSHSALAGYYCEMNH